MKNDKQMLDMLRNEFEKSSESVKIPLRLQKESMVAMLRSEENNKTDFSVKTGTKKKAGSVIRRYAAAAAIIVLVITGVISASTGAGSNATAVKVIRKDNFYSAYSGIKLVRPADSVEEIENVVDELSEAKNKPQPENVQQTTKPDDGKISGVNEIISGAQEIVDKLYEGYQSVAAIEKEAVNGDDISDGGVKTEPPADSFSAASKASSNTDVVVKSEVDADIRKINGDYLYVVTTGRNPETGNLTEQLKIVSTASGKEMKTVNSITLCDNAVAGASEECLEIAFKDNILIAIIERKDFNSENETTAVYYDITNPEKPVEIRRHTQDGKYLFSSFRENSFSLVTDKYVSGADFSVVPSFDVDGTQTALDTNEVFISVKDREASYIFITVTDISDFASPVGRLAIIGSGKRIYCSEGAITVTREFVTVAAEDGESGGSLTEITRFNVDGSSVSLAGTYVVEGSLIGGVSVNAKNDYMMFAFEGSDSCNVYILDKNMEFVSGRGEIFPGQKIDAVKFIGQKGYITSGGETMIINLSMPKYVKGAGIIPSKLFTGNLYEISESKLLDIYTDDNGKVTFRLFDISDLENPTDAAKYVTEDNYTVLSSLDSRSIMVVSEKEMFGVPVVVKNIEKGTETSAYLIMDVSDGTIKPVGLCRHEESYVGDAAVRALYNDGTIYTVSGQKIEAFSIDTLENISGCEIN